MRFFSTETRVYQWLDKYCTILLVGLVWLISMIPIITVGASFTAMSRMMFNIREGKPAGVVLFFRTFIKEFGKSTLLWLILLIVPAAVLSLYFFTGITSIVVITIIFLAVILWMMVFLYTFPLTAFFENSVGGTLKNALLLSLSFIRKTVPVLAISMSPIFVIMLVGTGNFIYYGWIWVFFLFPLMEYWKSYFFLKVFYEYVPEEQRLAFPDDEAEDN